MSVETMWGYTLTGLEEMPDMLNAEEFDTLTAKRFAGDVRIPATIKAACASIRNYVGWHLYPSAQCRISMRMNNRRVTRIGADLMVQLPAKFVTGIESVEIDGTVHEAFSFERNGILRIYDAPCTLRYTPIVITYIAGLTPDMMAGVMELVAHRVTHAAASSNGITSEAAGGVSVTYNANWVNSARATALPSDNKEVLEPYRVQGVF